MALSVMGGEFGGRRGHPPNPEDDVLCELNAEFRQSKCELIQRFLKDQEDLNDKFAEYALNSDDCDGSEGGQSSGSPSGPQGLQLPPGFQKGNAGEVFDVLEDIEDLDNLSITSAVNSSSDAPSLSDGGERASYEDLDEEHDYDENWNVTPQHSQHPPGSYDDQYYDQYRRDGPLLNPPVSPSDQIAHQPLEIVPQPRKSKKNKEGTPTRKVKKLLVKKNVRPQTAMGVRALPATDDLICAQPSDSRPKPISAGSTTFTLHDSINMVGARFKKISWTGGSDQHPELGRLSISASVQKFQQRSHTPGGRLKSSSSPLMTTAALSGLRGGGGLDKWDMEVDRKSSGHCQRRSPLSSPLSPTANPDLSQRDPFRACTPLGRPDSTMSNRSLISVDFGPEQLAGRRPGNSQPLQMRSSVYSAERGGRLVMSPSLADGKTKKRPIAVLKLPPLDSSVVNRAIGAATLEGAGHHQTSLVSPATAKANTVATPSAI